jgi:hypothetical protein
MRRASVLGESVVDILQAHAVARRWRIGATPAEPLQDRRAEKVLAFVGGARGLQGRRHSEAGKCEPQGAFHPLQTAKDAQDGDGGSGDEARSPSGFNAPHPSVIERATSAKAPIRSSELKEPTNILRLL